MISDRQEAIHRKRRIIFNDDSEVHREGSDTPEGLTGLRLAHIVDSQVDSIWWSFVYGPEMYLYDCKAGEIAGKEPPPEISKMDLERSSRLWHNMKSLLEAGTDPLREVVKFCHTHNKEMFASFRMNMISDSWTPSFTTKWKRDHPEYCLGTRGMYEFGKDRDPQKLYLYWSGLDYEQQAVRDQRLGLINDICTRYDVDGMELDFWRWPMFFKPSLDGLPVQQRHIDIMNNFMRRVRKRMLEIETERKRPLLLAPRVFDNLEICLRMGLDVKAWLEEGLIDLLVVGGVRNCYSIPVAEWVDLAHKHDVPLYACLYRTQGLERDRAAAAYYHSCGVDGLYTFNIFRFPRDFDLFREIGDPQVIAHKDKHYLMSGKVTDGFGHVCAPGQVVPVQLEQGTPRHVELLIGDDVQAAAADDSLAELKLGLSLTNFDPEKDEVGFKVNGRKIMGKFVGVEGKACKLEFIVYTIYTDLRREPPIRQGKNIIEATLSRRTSGLEGPVTLCGGVELWVRYQ